MVELVARVAHRRGITLNQARAVLWRECLGYRLRATIFVLGWTAPRRVDDIAKMVSGFGHCRSAEDAAMDLAFYQHQGKACGPTLGGLLFPINYRRLLRVALGYFEVGAPESPRVERRPAAFSPTPQLEKG